MAKKSKLWKDRELSHPGVVAPRVVRNEISGIEPIALDTQASLEDLHALFCAFFAPMREVDHELLDKLIHYDPACAMAFIAVDEQSHKMLGVVRLHDDTGGESAEFATSDGLAAQGPRSRLAFDEAHDRICKA